MLGGVVEFGGVAAVINFVQVVDKQFLRVGKGLDREALR